MINEKMESLNWVIDVAMDGRGMDMQSKVLREVTRLDYKTNSAQVNVFSLSESEDDC